MRTIPKSEAPGPGLARTTSFLNRLRKNPLALFRELQEEYGDIVRIQLPRQSLYIVANPEDVHHVLERHHTCYWKGRQFGRMRRIAGASLAFQEGAEWKRRRQQVQPAFEKTRLRLLVPLFASCADFWVRAIAREHDDERDLARDMADLTLEIASRAFLGSSLDQSHEFRDAVPTFLEFASQRLMSPVMLPLWLPTPRTVRFRAARRRLLEIVSRTISQRGAEGSAPLLSCISRDREGTELSAAEIRNEIMGFLLAGHETTAVALAWTWFLLSEHPHAEKRLHEELDRVLGGRLPNAENLEALNYTQAVIFEALRLYPPLWAVPREAATDDVIGGFTIEAGSAVLLPTFLIHRHPEFWVRPDDFEPERFATGIDAPPPRGSYLPFGLGPRACVGRDFALMEATVILATLAGYAKFKCVRPSAALPAAGFTLHPSGGLPARVEPRTRRRPARPLQLTSGR